MSDNISDEQLQYKKKPESDSRGGLLTYLIGSSAITTHGDTVITST